MVRRTPAQYDWGRAEFDETILPKHFSALSGRDIKFVVAHHMTIRGTGDGKANDACYNVWMSRQASAHYGVDGKFVRQFVWDKNFAWASGSNYGNLHGLHIEHANSTAGPGWRVSEETMATGARLAANLHVLYRLGRPTSNSNGSSGTLRQHDTFTSTACPGPYLGGSEWNRYVKMVQAEYDSIKGKPTPTPQPPVLDYVPWYTISFLNMWGDDGGTGTRTYFDRLPEMVLDLTKGSPDIVTGCEVRKGSQGQALRKELKKRGYPIVHIQGGNFAAFKAGTPRERVNTYTLPKKVQGEGRKEKLLRVRAKINGHWVHIGVSHLDYRKGARFDQLRVDQAKSIINAMKRLGVRYNLEALHRQVIALDSNSNSWVDDRAFGPAGYVAAVKKGIDEIQIGKAKGRPVLKSSSTPTASDHPVIRATIGKKA